MGLPLPPEAINTHFVEIYSSFASRPPFCPSVDSHREDWFSQPGSLHPSGAFSLAPLDMVAGSRLSGSRASLGTRASGGGTAGGSDTCWPEGLLPRVRSHAVSSPLSLEA